MRATSRPGLLITVAALLACGGDGSSGPSGRLLVDVSRDTATVMAGDTIHVAATVTDTLGATVSVRPAFASSDERIAVVDGEGIVTGRSPGIVHVSARAGGDTARVTVTVTRGAASIVLAAGPDSTVIGNRFALPLAVLDSSGARLDDPRPISITSSDSLVAMVEGGDIRITGVGDATITVRVGPFRRQLAVRGRLAQVGAGSAWLQLDGGEEYACALTTAGEPHCWGANFAFRLGYDGDSWTARRVSGTTVFARIVTGYSHNCGLDADSVAWCWGAGVHAQLGGGAPTGDTPTPIREATGRRWAMLAVGGHGGNCGLDAVDSLLYCWGHNDLAQLGLPKRSRPGTGFDIHAPTLSWAGIKARTASLENYHGCMVAADGAAWCSGDPIGLGGIGAAVTADSAPWPVQGDHRFVQVGTGGPGYSCGLRTDGRITCWGDARYLGTGETEAVVRAEPQAPIPGLRFDELRVGPGSACARGVDGAWWCWGRNALGRATDGTYYGGDFAYVPVKLELPFTWRDVQPAGRFTCGITTANAVYCWGRGSWFGAPSTAEAAARQALVGSARAH